MKRMTEDREEISKLVLLRLEPCIRTLLALIRERLHETNLEKAIALYTQIEEQLSRLQRELQSLQAFLDPADWGESLYDIFDFLSLPLVILLRSVAAGRQKDETNAIHQTVEYKCITRVSKILGEIIKSTKDCPLDVEKRIKCLADCVAVGGPISNNKTLDRGEECMRSLFSTMSILLEQYPERSLEDAVEGSLLAGIVDICVRMLESGLAIESLATLKVAFDAIKEATAWRVLFPGIFVDLYRCIMQSIRQSKYTIIVPALQVLVRLLERCLQREPPHALSLNDIIIKSKSGLEKEEEKDGEFFQKVNESLPAPLNILVNSLVTCRSENVREEVCNLCRTLLSTVPYCWNKEVSQEMMYAVMEACLVLTEDSDKDVARKARQVLNDFLRDNSLSSSIDIPSRIMQRLLALGTLAQGQKESEIQSNLKKLIAYLSLVLESKPARRSLLSLFELQQTDVCITLNQLCDVSFDFSDPASVSVDLVHLPSQIEKPTEPAPKYISRETRVAVLSMVRQLGKVLGAKPVTLLIDNTIASLYESILGRVESGFSLVGDGHTVWLHEWIGIISILRPFMEGAFCNGDSSDAKQQKCIDSLLSSVLPVLVSSPLWDLPCVDDPLLLNKGKQSAAPALRGNSLFRFYLLDILPAFFSSSERKRVEVALPIIIHPILETLGYIQVPLVRSMATFVLTSIAHFCEYSSATDLLLGSFDIVVTSILGKLRVTRRKCDAFGEVMLEILREVGTATAILRIASMHEMNHERDLRFHSRFLSREELVAVVLERIDRFVFEISKEETYLLVVISFYRAVIETYLAGVESMPNMVTSVSIREPWLQTLSYFLVDQSELIQELTCDVDDSGKNTMTDDTSCFKNDINLVSQMMFRCCYFLSYASLKVQINSCCALSAGFEFLGIISNLSLRDAEENGPSSAIFRQVASSWPKLNARMVAVSSFLTRVENTRSSSLSDTFNNHVDKESNVTEQRLFLSVLFELAAVMIECADDFMARRFEENLWPIVSSIFNYFLRLRKFPYETSERRLLLSSFDLIDRALKKKKFGMTVKGLLPTMGTIILPFLGENDQSIRSVCHNTIKSLLDLDADCLYRQLIDASREDLQLCPLDYNHRQQETQMPIQCMERDSTQQLFLSLLDYVNNIPEQPL